MIQTGGVDGWYAGGPSCSDSQGSQQTRGLNQWKNHNVQARQKQTSEERWRPGGLCQTAWPGSQGSDCFHPTQHWCGHWEWHSSRIQIDFRIFTFFPINADIHPPILIRIICLLFSLRNPSDLATSSCNRCYTNTTKRKNRSHIQYSF